MDVACNSCHKEGTTEWEDSSCDLRWYACWGRFRFLPGLVIQNCEFVVTLPLPQRAHCATKEESSHSVVPSL